MSNDVITRATINGVLSAGESLSGQVSPSAEEPKKINGQLTVPSSRYVIERDYELLENKPSVNDVVLIKNKTFDELGLNALSNSELEALLS